MSAFAAPLIPGKLDAWESFVGELNGSRKADFDDFNSRYGLTQHEAFLQENPDGSHLVVVVVDGPGADSFQSRVGASDHPFDQWFVDSVAEAHGMDLRGPVPPMPKQLL